MRRQLNIWSLTLVLGFVLGQGFFASPALASQAQGRFARHAHTARASVWSGPPRILPATPLRVGIAPGTRHMAHLVLKVNYFGPSRN